MVLTPILTQSVSIARVQLLYGIVAAFSSVLFILLAREKPPTPPCPAGQETRALMLDGLKNALRNRMFWMFLVICFIALGIFNGCQPGWNPSFDRVDSARSRRGRSVPSCLSEELSVPS